jgi:hypothetical protein
MKTYREILKGSELTEKFKEWDAKTFMPIETAKLIGDSRMNYTAFKDLSKSDRQQAIGMYPHTSTGGKYDFIHNHYYYPTVKNGKLANAGRRVLAIPFKKLKDEKYMKALGYEINADWIK